MTWQIDKEKQCNTQRYSTIEKKIKPFKDLKQRRGLAWVSNPFDKKRPGLGIIKSMQRDCILMHIYVAPRHNRERHVVLDSASPGGVFFEKRETLHF
jgi:hypothetical protein